MAIFVYADELSESEISCLLRAPLTETYVTKKGNRDVIRYHRMDTRQLFWLAKELGYNSNESDLACVLDSIYWDEPLYRVHFQKKRSGGLRRISAPVSMLMRVQKRILRHILNDYKVSDSAFGFSGGSIFDALRPHQEAGNGSLLAADIVDAFSSVSFGDVFSAIYGLPLSENYSERDDKGYLSWEVAYAITRMVTVGGKLPQGAPTSPKLFDMVFLPIDRKLERLAANVCGIYTRYADNIYFSMPQDEFPPKVERAIIRTIHESKWEKDVQSLTYWRRFACHKVRTCTLGTESIRALGVNLTDGEIMPTRKLKRQIRLSIHRLNWLIRNTPQDRDSITECWSVLQGQMSFANECVLPDSLNQEYEEVKTVLENLLVNGEVPS